MKINNKAGFIIIGFVAMLLIGIIIPFIFHEKAYIYYDTFPFAIIDMNEKVTNIIRDEYDQPGTIIKECVKRDIYKSNIDLSAFEKFLLKRITITDKIKNLSDGSNHYVIDLKTLFNIKYKHLVTQNIDPLLINRGCR